MTKTFQEETDEIEVRWQLAIGSFLISFGKIEWFTYLLLCQLPTEDIFDSIRDLSFTKRKKLIKQLLPQKIKDTELCLKVNKLLSSACNFSETRNTIAHNPIDLSFFDGPSGIDLRHTISKFRPDMNARMKTEITIETLEEKCKEIGKLSGECYELEGKIDRYLFDNIGKI